MLRALHRSRVALARRARRAVPRPSAGQRLVALVGAAPGWSAPAAGEPSGPAAPEPSGAPGGWSGATGPGGSAGAARLARLGRAVLWLGRAGLLRAYYQAQLRRPLDPTLALYAAYWYRGYACNPAAIYAKAREVAPHIRGVWVVRRDRVGSLPPGVPYVVAGTRAYFRALARARWLINNVNFPDYVVKRRGAVHVQTHHGTPVKVMGLDQQRYPAGAVGLDFSRLLRRIDRWDYSITSNRFSTQMWERAYPAEYVTLETGYPRNDRLVNATPEEVAAVRERLGLPPGSRVVLYAPTHREHRPGYWPPFDPSALLDVLGASGLLLIRGHYLDPGAAVGVARAPGAVGVDGAVRPLGTAPARVDGAAQVDGVAQADGAGWADGAARVRDVTDHPVVEDLYLAADVLITDYSSAMFDYGCLDRPIVIYAPDWADYRRERGVYLDVLAEAPGAAATSFPELLALFRTGAVDDAAARRARTVFRRRYCALDDGRAAERVVRHVLLDEPVGAPTGPGAMSAGPGAGSPGSGVVPTGPGAAPAPAQEPAASPDGPIR
ncbi:CDP-glycerol glycerophosphotransferase family protein [Micromonospora sp. HM5-17]|nr:CDP-glycerol glycerophosphotransferase family protein [Micromonospora sp. HM5-17]